MNCNYPNCPNVASNMLASTYIPPYAACAEHVKLVQNAKGYATDVKVLDLDGAAAVPNPLLPPV
jgi:hypothetical protein